MIYRNPPFHRRGLRLARRSLRPLAVLLVLLAVVAGAALACTGVSAGIGEPIPAGGESLPPELRKVAEAYRILLAQHIDRAELTPDELADGAVRGILAALDDPHASYLSAEQHNRDQEEFRGYFEGIGAQVAITDAGLTVIAPIPGAPAEAAGILPGDIILAVDGESVAELSLIAAVDRIRGPGGSDVTLLIRHDGDTESVAITVTRGRIPIESVAFRMLDHGIGHLWIYSFSNTTEAETRDAIREFRDAGGRGLILDLRNNPGGLLQSVVDVAGLFLDGGPILYEIDAQGNRNDYEASRRGPAENIPMVTLVNEYSASASEILAGAIKTNGRATIAGATTFGKGSVNITRELSDGSAIYFSIRRWYLPDGTQIEGHGVIPDVPIDAELERLPMPVADDAALREAVAILRRQLPAAP